MFEEWIAQGESMVNRLRLERSGSPAATDGLPSAKRVPRVELEKWMKRVRQRISEHFSEDTLLRLDDISEISSEDLMRNNDSPVEQSIIWLERIIEFLRELEERSKDG